jgi:hypothetical protein
MARASLLLIRLAFVNFCARCPFVELKKLRSKLKPDGKMVFVVPHEKKGSRTRWRPNGINQHLIRGLHYALETYL